MTVFGNNRQEKLHDGFDDFKRGILSNVEENGFPIAQLLLNKNN